MPNHPASCVCAACQRDGTGDFAMREAFAILRTDRDGRCFDLYRWLVDVRLAAKAPARVTPTAWRAA